MTANGGRRRGIATVVGMLFMSLIFLVALGAQVYLSDAQGATAAAQSQAQQRAVLRGQELFSYGGAPGNLEATNAGGETTTVVALLLKFENGTIYNLNANSTPPLHPPVIPSGEGVMVQAMVPEGACFPANWTCVSVYRAITGSRIPGRAVGLVTSLGNTFWYFPTAFGIGNRDPTVFRTPKVESTSASNYTAIPGLGFSAVADSFYMVELRIGYWQSGATSNADMFAIAVSSGTTFMFCGGLSWSAPTGSDSNQSPGNLCSSVPGQSLGPTWSSGNSCNFQQLGCEFVGTAYVSFGPAGGTFAMEFEGTPNGEANVFADSVIMATLAQ